MKDIVFNTLFVLSNIWSCVIYHYNILKYKVFDGKVITAKIYNRKTRQSSEIYNYDNIVYLLIIFVTEYMLKCNMFVVWSIEDLSLIVNNPNILVVCKCIKNNKETSHIYSKETYNRENPKKKKLVYSILHLPDGTDKNLCRYIRPYVQSLLCDHDITWREVLDVTLNRDAIAYIVTMADDDCQEKCWKSEDVATI